MLENPGAAVLIGIDRAWCTIWHAVAVAILSASGIAQVHPSPSPTTDFQSLLHQGFELHEKSDYARAIPVLRRAYSMRPRDYFVNLLLGIDLLRTGQAADAIRFLRMAAKTHPREEFPDGYLGEAEASLGHFAEAAAAYIQATRVAPESSQAAITLADFSLDRFAKIAVDLRSSRKGLAAEYRLQAVAKSTENSSRLELLARAADLDEGAPGIWSEIALVQIAAYDFEAARKSATRALLHDSNDLRAWQVQTYIAASDNDAKYVVDRLNAIAQRSPSALVQTLRDWPQELHVPSLEIPQGPAARFLTCLRQPTCTPDDLLSRISAPAKLPNPSSDSLYREQRWEQLATLSPPIVSQDIAWFQRGAALAHLKKCEDAIPALERSLYHTTAPMEARFLLSICYSREAASVAEQAKQTTGEDTPFHTIRGDVLLRLQANPEGAIEEYEAGLAQRRNNPILWARLAEAQVGAGRLEAAKQSAQAALRLEEKCLPAKRTLANIAMQERDYPAALSYLRELAAHAPHELTTRVELGTACAQTGALEEALANLGPALRQGYPDEKGSLHYLLGTVLRRMGKRAEAQRAFDTARELSDHFQQSSHQAQDE
jgi:tetratricopeptide (TPR) repeat protein